jgi:urease accessory protein
MRTLKRLSPLAILLMPLAAQAHSNADNGSMWGGFLHPLTGPDHLTAMLGVGIVSVLIHRRYAVYLVPGAFVLAMLLAGTLGVYGVELPRIELGIALSVLLLGVAILANQRLNLWLVMGVCFLFGCFHGNAHGLEMPRAASPVFYVMGFVITTITIHVLGVGIGFLPIFQKRSRLPMGLLGAVVSAVGVIFMIRAVA